MSFNQLLMSTLGQDAHDDEDNLSHLSNVDLVDHLYEQVVAQDDINTLNSNDNDDLLENTTDTDQGNGKNGEDQSEHGTIEPEPEVEEEDEESAAAMENGLETEQGAENDHDHGTVGTTDDPETDTTVGFVDQPPASKKDKVTDDQIRKNRNAAKQFNNLKTKLEGLQSRFQGEPNFVLFMENNFVKKVGHTGPTPASSGKVMVLGKGKLMDLFKTDDLAFDFELMDVLKTGVKGVVPDAQFLKDYTKFKKPSVPVQAVNAAGSTNPSMLHMQMQLQQQMQHQMQLQMHQQQLQMSQYPSPAFFSSPSMVPSLPFGSPTPSTAVVETSPATSDTASLASVAQMPSTESSAVGTSGKSKEKNPPKKNLPRSSLFDHSSDESYDESELVDDETDYSEEDQNFISQIERKNQQRKQKTVVLSDSEEDLTESDHGCEVFGD